MKDFEAYISEARQLLFGSDDVQSHEKGIKIVETLEKEGHSISNLLFGIAYYIGRGVEENNERAVEYFEKALNDGYVSASYYLGLCYYHGYGVDQDRTLAYGLLRNASEEGHEDARAAVHGEFYFTFDEKDPWEKEALEDKKVTEENLEECIALANEGQEIYAYLLAEYYRKKKEFSTAKQWGRIAQDSKLSVASMIMWWIDHDIRSIETDKIDDIYRELNQNGIPLTGDGHEPNAVLVPVNGEPLVPIYIGDFSTSESLGKYIDCDRIDIISTPKMKKLSDMMLETLVGYCDGHGYQKKLCSNSVMQNLSGYLSIRGSCVICGYDKDYIPLSAKCAVALARWYNDGGRIPRDY